MEKKLLERFKKKNCKRKNKNDFRTKRKDDKLYNKCKGYDHSFSSPINEKDIV